MKEMILAQIEQYKGNLSQLDEKRGKINQEMQENSISIEQNRGALSAVYRIATENGYVDEKGEPIVDEVEEIQAEIVK